MGPLFHVSEDGAIRRFEPRPPPVESGLAEPVVWAVDGARLPHYLLPRECPRVAFAPRPGSTASDVARLMGLGPAARVAAIEAAWFARACATTLYVYRLPAATFRVLGATAGYHVSAAAVVPLAARRVENPLAELLRHGAVRARAPVAVAAPRRRRRVEPRVLRHPPPQRGAAAVTFPGASR